MQYVSEYCPEAQEVVDFLGCTGTRMLFGCGEQSRNFTFLMSLLAEEPDGYIVTEVSAPNYLGKPVYSKGHCAQDTAVLVAVNEAVAPDIKQDLQTRGYECVFTVPHWETVNDIIKEAVFFDYCEEKAIPLVDDVIHLGDCTFCNPLRKGRAYRQMFFGTAFSQLLLPGLLHDTRYGGREKFSLCEERMCPGEIALDIGANVGIFTGYLSSLGWNVIAFEPAHSIWKDLDRNVRLHGTARAEPLAVSSKTGRIDFYDVADYPKYSSTEERRNAIKYTVRAVSLDDYARENKLSPRFIHIDIGISVLPILQGGVRCIENYAPDLLVEGTENSAQLVQIIQALCNNYCTVCGEDWMYAYCPR